MRGIFGWLGRKAGLYVLLVVAIGVGTVAVPWAKQVITGVRLAEVREQVLGDTTRTIATERDDAANTFRAHALSLRSKSAAQLDDQRRRLRLERDDLRKQIGDEGPAWALALVDQKALLNNERRKLRVAWIDQELAAIDSARAAVASNGASIAAQANLDAQQKLVARTVPLCKAATQRVGSFEERWRWRLRQWWESDEHKAMVDARNQRCNVARAAIQRRDQLITVARQKAQLQRDMDTAFVQAANTTTAIKGAGRDLAKDAERAKIELSGSLGQKLRLWTERLGLVPLLCKAAIALGLIIATPFLIRLFFYFVLAPIAMRRPVIRLHIPEGRGVQIFPAGLSSTSAAVRLEPGEELLVRQDYLQTSSLAGSKGTQWFLDWRKPLTSIATGLTFLTRIRGDGEVTTVSAVRDGLAEVTILILPDGATCVLKPRALAGVAQPIRRPMRITRHWRLGSLNAWLTLQLRYLVFHGPARLVLKGGRGVRVEAAEQGRVFGQDQLVGFSADLAYSVTRTETFWPYFLGREQLLKDRVLAGAGVLIIEEAPLTTLRGEVRRGLEGFIDAIMKAFGM